MKITLINRSNTHDMRLLVWLGDVVARTPAMLLKAAVSGLVHENALVRLVPCQDEAAAGMWFEADNM